MTQIFDAPDLELNELQNWLNQSLGTDPTGGSLIASRQWYRSDIHRLKVFDGTTAQTVAWESDSLSVFGVPTGDVPWGANKITGVKDPTNPQDAGTKAYIDAAVAVTPPAVLNSDWKASVKAVAQTNGTLASAYANGQVVDGYTLVTGDPILIMGQTTVAENGLYTVNATGAPTLRADAASGTQLTLGATVYAENSRAYWRYISGAFNAQVWSNTWQLGPTSGAPNNFLSSGTGGGPVTLSGQASLALVGSSNTLLVNSTGLGLNGRTPAAALDLASSTAAAGGIGFGNGDFQVFRDASSSLTIGATTTKVTNLLVAGPADHGTQLVRFGSTGSDAAIKKDATGVLGVRLGDDSAYAGLHAAAITSAALTASGTIAANGGLAVGASQTIDMGSNRVQNVATPTATTDAANKGYVDGLLQGLITKPAALVATVGTETFTIASGTVTQITGTTIDGKSPAIGDRILIKDAPASTGVGSVGSSQPGNGLYIVTNATTNLTVARDVSMDVWAEVPSAYVWVEEGTSTQADTGWTATADPGGTLGTTAIQWVLFASAGTLVAGAGLTKVGNVINVIANADASIQVNADDIQVAALGITNAKIANATIDLTAKVTGALPVLNGGTGSTTAAGARTNLGAAGVQTFTITHDGTTTTFTLTHTLNNNQPLIGAWNDNAGVPGDTIILKAHRNSANATNIVYPVALTSGVKHYVTCIG